MINITFDEKIMAEADFLLRDCRQEIHKAAANAINRAAIKVRKESSDIIRKSYIVKVNVLKKSFSRIKAKPNNLEGMIFSKGTPLMLNSFLIRARKKRPYGVQVKQDGMPKDVKGLFVKKQLPLQRVGATRYPLRVLHGPSAPQMFGNEESLKMIVPVAEETLNERFLHEIEYRFGRRHK